MAVSRIRPSLSSFLLWSVALLFAVHPALSMTGATTYPFDKFFIIILENTDYDSALADPYLGSVLTQKGRLLTNYIANSHPSLPNYLAMSAGQYFNISDDDVHNLTAPTIVDLLEAKNVSWGCYQENYPGNCFLNASNFDMTYRRKHSPFISFSTVTGNADRCSKIVPATFLPSDMARNVVPEWAIYIPNMNNDGHDTNTNYLSNWLELFLEPLLVHPSFASTLFLVTFDEAETYTKPNQVYAVLLGAGVQAGTVDNSSYSHYSQLAFAEARWSLGSLGQGDATAMPFTL